MNNLKLKLLQSKTGLGFQSALLPAAKTRTRFLLAFFAEIDSKYPLLDSFYLTCIFRYYNHKIGCQDFKQVYFFKRR